MEELNGHARIAPIQFGTYLECTDGGKNNEHA